MCHLYSPLGLFKCNIGEMTVNTKRYSARLRYIFPFQSYFVSLSLIPMPVLVSILWIFGQIRGDPASVHTSSLL